jgi:hypothetical protein
MLFGSLYDGARTLRYGLAAVQVALHAAGVLIRLRTGKDCWLPLCLLLLRWRRQWLPNQVCLDAILLLLQLLVRLLLGLYRRRPALQLLLRLLQMPSVALGYSHAAMGACMQATASTAA